MIGGVAGETTAEEALGQVWVDATFAIVAAPATGQGLSIANGPETISFTPGVALFGVTLDAEPIKAFEVRRRVSATTALGVVLARAAGVVVLADRVGRVVTSRVALTIAVVAQLASSPDAFVPIAELGNTGGILRAGDAREVGRTDGSSVSFGAPGVRGGVTLSTTPADALLPQSAVDALALGIAQTAAAGEAIAIAYGLRRTWRAAGVVTGVTGPAEPGIRRLLDADVTGGHGVVRAGLVITAGGAGVFCATDGGVGERVAALVIGRIAFLTKAGDALIPIPGTPNALQVDVARVADPVTTEGLCARLVTAVVIARVATLADPEHALGQGVAGRCSAFSIAQCVDLVTFVCTRATHALGVADGGLSAGVTARVGLGITARAAASRSVARVRCPGR